MVEDTAGGPSIARVGRFQRGTNKMPLILTPSFDEHTRQQIEAHLEEVRARRLVAALEFEEGRKGKIAKQADKVARQMQAQYKMLKKELIRLEGAETKVQERLTKLTHLLNEHGLLEDLE